MPQPPNFLSDGWSDWQRKANYRIELMRLDAEDVSMAETRL